MIKYAPAPLRREPDAPISADDINYKRRMALALSQQGTDASPVGHWTQALARAAQGAVGGMYASQAASDGRSREAYDEKQSANKRIAEREAAFQDKQRLMLLEQQDPMYQARLRATNAELATTEEARTRQKQFYDQFNQTQPQALQPAPEQPSMPTEGVGRFSAPGLEQTQQPASVTPRQLFDQLPPDRKAAAKAALQMGDQETFMKILTQGAIQPKKSVTEMKQIHAADDEVPVYQQTIDTLDAAEKLISQEAETNGTAAFEGTGAGWAGSIGSRWPGGDMLFDNRRAKATDEYGSLMSMEAIKAMADTLKGATTDFELGKFVEILADPSQPREIRRRTIQRMRSLAKNRLGLAKRRSQEIRSGDYYRPNNGGSGAPSGPIDMGGGFTVEIE